MLKELSARIKRVPYSFFVKRVWTFLLCVESERGIRESTFIHPRETGFPFFHPHVKFVNERLCRNNFTFLEILVSTKSGTTPN